MSVAVPITAVANSVTAGLNFLTEKQRTELQRDHAEALADLKAAEDAQPPSYNDDDLIDAEERLANFMIAFGAALAVAAQGGRS